MEPTSLITSRLVSGLSGSEILKITYSIQQLIAAGKKISNFTVGDFNPNEFPIPDLLRNYIQQAYAHGNTNYPPAMGTLELRKAVTQFIRHTYSIDYQAEEVLIAAGARPLIYTTFLGIIDPGETVLYAVPSWNTPYYCYLSNARPAPLKTDSQNGFLLTPDSLKPHISKANLLVLNSPSNPTGTMFSSAQLAAICELILAENQTRIAQGKKPLYLLYDQMYATLTFGYTHTHPVAVYSEMFDYTIYIDGISKSMAATGVRVGWLTAPKSLVAVFSNLLMHIGAWAPKPEQIATANFLNHPTVFQSFTEQLSARLAQRLQKIHQAFITWKSLGLPVDSIAPQGAMYLSVQFAIIGYQKPDGSILETNQAIADFMLHEAQCGFVPFQAFGVIENEGWFRLSVGGVTDSEIEQALRLIPSALQTLNSKS